MKIAKDSVVTLADGKKYLVLAGDVLEGETFCLVSTIKPLFAIQVLEVVYEGEKCILKPYTESDYKYILKILVKQIKVSPKNN